MLRYQCDGCDEVSMTTVADHPTNEIISVHIGVRGRNGNDEFERHLCERCERRLKDYADPRKWPRALKAVK